MPRHKPCPDCASAVAEGWPGRIRVVREDGVCAPCSEYRKITRLQELDSNWYRWAWRGNAAKFRRRQRRRRSRKH